MVHLGHDMLCRLNRQRRCYAVAVAVPVASPVDSASRAGVEHTGNKVALDLAPRYASAL